MFAWSCSALKRDVKHRDAMSCKVRDSMPKIKGEPKEQMTIRIAADTFRKLEENEKRLHVSKSVLIQMALDKFLADMEK